MLPRSRISASDLPGSNENSHGPQSLVFLQPTTAAVRQHQQSDYDGSVATMEVPNGLPLARSSPAPAAVHPLQNKIKATKEGSSTVSRVAPTPNPFTQTALPMSNKNRLGATGGFQARGQGIPAPQPSMKDGCAQPTHTPLSNNSNNALQIAVTGIVANGNANNSPTMPTALGAASTTNATRLVRSNPTSTPTMNGGSVVKSNTEAPTSLVERSSSVSGACSSTLSSCCRHFVSVKVLVGLLCAFLLACTAGGVLWLMYSFSIKATRDEGMRHVDTITSKARSDLENFIAVPSAFTNAWQHALNHSDDTLPSETLVGDLHRAAEIFDLRFSNGLVTPTIPASVTNITKTYTSMQLETMGSSVYNGGLGGQDLSPDQEAYFTGTKVQWFEPYFDKFRMAINMSGYTLKWGTIGFEDGRYVECVVDGGSANFSCSYTSKRINLVVRHTRGQPMEIISTSPSFFAYTRECVYRLADGALLKKSSVLSTYDPRNRSWYYAAPRVPFGSGWSEPYPTASPPVMAVDVSRSVFNARGSFLGLLALTIDLTELTNFLSQIGAGTRNSVSILLDQNEKLLATSWQDVTYHANKTVFDTADDLCQPLPGYSTSFLCVLSVQELGYTPMVELTAQHSQLIRYGARETSRLQLDNMYYFVGVAKIRTPVAGTELTHILFMPEDDLISDVVTGRNVGAYICIGVVLVAVVINLVVLTFLLKPLGELADDMFKVAVLQTDDTFDSKKFDSALYEIAAIQSAFVWMRGELHAMKKFVPHSLLAAQRISSDDDDDDGPIITDSQDETVDGSRTFVVSPMTVGIAQIDTVVDFANENPNFERSESRQNHSRNSRQTSRPGRSTALGNLSVPNQGTMMKSITISQTLNMSATIHSRKVTMLAANVCQFHSHLATCPDASMSVMGVVSEVVHAMERAAIENKGVLDGFLGDRFLISFNAVTPVGNHAANAAGCALAAGRNLAQIRINGVQNITLHRGSQPRSLRLTSGIASGHVLVGNMGSNGVKRFTILGHAVSSATVLERLCKRYAPDTVALASNDSLPDIENFYEYLLVDAVELPLPAPEYRQSDGTNSVHLANRRVIASLRGPRIHGNNGSSEWMYTIAEGEKASKYEKLNRAFLTYIHSTPAVSQGTTHADTLPVQSMGTQVAPSSSPAGLATISPQGLSPSSEVADWMFAAKEALRLAIADIDFRDPSTESQRLTVELLQTLIGKGIPGVTYCNPLSQYYQECVLSTMFKANSTNNNQYNIISEFLGGLSNTNNHANQTINGGEGIIGNSSIYDLVSVENY